MIAPRILAAATAVPEHVALQGEVKAMLAAILAEVPAASSTRRAHAAAGAIARGLGGGVDASEEFADDADWQRLLSVFDNGGIVSRRLCMPIAWYGEDHSFGERNTLYIEHGVRLASAAIRAALERAGLGVRDVDHIVFVSSTGVATPSLDALIANHLGLRRDVRRTPIWGLGCAGGAAGLARARDFAAAAPGTNVLLVALELCGFAFQRRERSKRNLVAASLFADGCAAVIVSSPAAGAAPAGTGLAVEASASTLWPDTLDVMGWEVDGDGLHVVFSRDIPTIVRKWVRESVDKFLDARGLTLADVDHVVSHPGGMKVLQAYQEALDLPPDTFRHARDVLRERGNMSSPTCLFVLERFIEARAIAPGQTALLTALGPGFSAEYVLLRGVRD